MFALEALKEYRNLIITRKGLEYKYCLEIDKDKKLNIKKRMQELKLHIRILENGLGVLKPEEREVIYLAYFKKDFKFTGWTNVAVVLSLDISTVYKYKQHAVIKIDKYLRAIGVTDDEYCRLRKRLGYDEEILNEKVG